MQKFKMQAGTDIDHSGMTATIITSQDQVEHFKEYTSWNCVVY